MFSNRISFRNMNFNARLLRRHQRNSFRAASQWIPQRPVLGLEISGTSLSLACFKPRFGRGGRINFGSIPGFTALSPQSLRAKLEEFLRPFNIEEPQLVLGLPRREVIVRFLHLPSAAAKALKEAVALQAEMFKPADTEEFDWDSTVIDEGQRHAVALVLIPHSTIEKLANLFSEAGFPLSRLAPTQFSLLHLFLREQGAVESQRLVLLDFKDGEVELALVEGKRLVYSRAFPLSANAELASQGVRSEIHQAFSTLRWKEQSSQTVLTSGEFPKPVEEALTIFGRVERLADKMGLHRFSDQSGMQWRLGAAALALSNFTRTRRPYCVNLLPAKLRPVSRRLRHLPTYALLVANAALLIAMGFRVPVENYVLLRQYRREIATVRVRAEEMKHLLQTNRDMRQELLTLEALQRNGRQPLDALNEIAQKLPQEAWLNTFSCRKGQVDLNGSAKAAALLLPLFQSSPLFQEAKFNGGLTQDSSGAEHFRLQLRMKEKP